MKLHLLLSGLIATFLATAQTAIAQPSALSTIPEKFRLGFIAPLSGPARIYGDAAKNGLELALNEIGREWIEVIYEDDEFKPAKTVSAFHKLRATHRVDALICVASTPCNAVAPLAQHHGIPLFAWASDTKVSAGRPFVIRTYPSGINEGKRVAEEALKLLLRNVALIVSVNDYSNSWREGFKESFPRKDVVLDEEVPNDSKDFRALLLKASTRKAANFAVCLDPGQNAAFAKQARALIANAAFFGCESLHDSAEIQAASGALDNAWFATIFVSDDFKTKYVARFGNDSVISGAANHYDLTRILHGLAGRGGKETLVARLLSHHEHDGAVGSFRIVESDGDRYFDIGLHIKAAKSLRVEH